MAPRRRVERPAGRVRHARADIIREVQLVDGAIRLVADGICLSTTVGGLRHGPRVLERLAGQGTPSGLIVTAVRYEGEVGCGIRVSRQAPSRDE